MTDPAPSGGPALEAFDLYRFFHSGDDETRALRGISLRVHGGEVVAVVGPSGSGKSTLLSCLAGLDEPTGGWVRVAGEHMSRQPERRRTALRGRAIGVLSQREDLVAHLSVLGNVVLVQRLGRARRRSDPVALVAAVGLAHRLGAMPSTLSGGEAARAALAVALANDPTVLLADEPTGELDAEASAAVAELLRRRAQEGLAVVVATHDRAIAAAADRVIHLLDGRIAA